MKLIDHTIIFLVNIFVLAGHLRLARLYYSRNKGTVPNVAFPRCANDKYFWRKVFDRNPTFTRVCDKLEVRKWLEENNIGIASANIRWKGKAASELPKSH